MSSSITSSIFLESILFFFKITQKFSHQHVYFTRSPQSLSHWPSHSLPAGYFVSCHIEKTDTRRKILNFFSPRGCFLDLYPCCPPSSVRQKQLTPSILHNSYLLRTISNRLSSFFTPLILLCTDSSYQHFNMLKLPWLQ